MPSGPGALPDDICFTAFVTSAMLGNAYGWRNNLYIAFKSQKKLRPTNVFYLHLACNTYLGCEKKIDDESKWKMYADLAIAWNCSAVARRKIFNNANNHHWQVSLTITENSFFIS